MPVYVTEYAEELNKLGEERFLRAYPHPVLVVSGIAGILKEQTRTGTVVAESAEILLVGSLVGRVFPLVKGKFSPRGPVMIGRTDLNDVTIPEYSISKQHCFIATVGNDTRLTDAGSTNGTQVNGTTLDPHKPLTLLGGETLTLGRFALLFLKPKGFVDYLLTKRS